MRWRKTRIRDSPSRVRHCSSSEPSLLDVIFDSQLQVDRFSVWLVRWRNTQPSTKMWSRYECENVCAWKKACVSLARRLLKQRSPLSFPKPGIPFGSPSSQWAFSTSLFSTTRRTNARSRRRHTQTDAWSRTSTRNAVNVMVTRAATRRVLVSLPLSQSGTFPSHRQSSTSSRKNGADAGIPSSSGRTGSCPTGWARQRRMWLRAKVVGTFEDQGLGR